MVAGAAVVAVAVVAVVLSGFAKRPKQADAGKAGEKKEQHGSSSPADIAEDTASVEAQDAPSPQTGTQSAYLMKASALLKLLDAVKKTEGIREVTVKEIENLENQITGIKKSLEGDGTKYDLKEAGVRMTYAYSRIDWIIKSYPRLRNDSEMSNLEKEVKRINRRIDNLEDEV